MLVSNPERFVIIPNIDEGAKFVIAHEAKENISPKETSAITSNGTHIITPSKGYDAMREVEVDVNVDLKGSLQDKSVTITENGTQIITADEGFEGLNSVEVVSEVVDTGYDLVSRGASQDFSNYFNEVLLSDIEYTKSFFESLNGQSNISSKGKDDKRLLFTLPFDDSKVTNSVSLFENSGIKFIDNFVFKGWCEYTFKGCQLRTIPSVIDLTLAHGACGVLRDIIVFKNDNPKIRVISNDTYLNIFLSNSKIPNVEEVEVVGKCGTHIGAIVSGCNFPTKLTMLETENTTTFNQLIWLNYKTTIINLGSIKKGNNLSNIINVDNKDNNVTEFTCKEWKSIGLDLYYSPKLTYLSIRYIIWHALNGENALGFENEGATSRTLRLHATPYASWEEWKTTKPSIEDCEFLGISEEEITKYGELTWEDIALNIKLITIAK